MGWTRLDTKIAVVLILLSVVSLALRHTAHRIRQGLSL